LATENETPTVRVFQPSDSDAVADLFVRVNRLLAPAEMTAAFETYIQRSLEEEIGRIGDYYAERQGSFHVAELSHRLCGMFGLEASGPDAMELRRMYVDPFARGRGIGRVLLDRAEKETVAAGRRRLVLSTSEIQEAALSLYRSSGYLLAGEEIARSATLKAVGGGLRRYRFEKHLFQADDS